MYERDGILQLDKYLGLQLQIQGATHPPSPGRGTIMSFAPPPQSSQKLF